MKRQLKIKKLSIVVSFKDEEQNIVELTERIQDSVSKLKRYELIFVNDNSSDRSEELIKKLMKANKNVVLVNMSRTFGVSECVLAGMEVSTGDAVIYMDADLQDPPELIPNLVSAFEESNCEIVHTVRTARLSESRIKMFVTKLGYRYLNRAYPFKIEAEAGDYKLLSRKIVNLLLLHSEQLPFLRGLIANLGYPQCQIEYVRQPRGDGAKNTKFRLFSTKWMRGHLDRTLISFTDIPLKFSLVLGFFLSISSVLMIFVVITMKIIGLSIPGWAGIMCTVLLLGGVQSLILGIFGLYLNVIFLEVKNRPSYIIKEILRK
jgi:glycosyltransferase involved in cell wall biosynthesis